MGRAGFNKQRPADIIGAIDWLIDKVFGFPVFASECNCPGCVQVIKGGRDLGAYILRSRERHGAPKEKAASNAG